MSAPTHRSGLPVNQCLLKYAHGPHAWWYTSSGGGHMLNVDPVTGPTAHNYQTERNLKQHWCLGSSRNERSVPSGEPDLPYGTTNPSSGFSGSSTSEAAVRAEDADGRTKDKQLTALYTLDLQGGGPDGQYVGRSYGMTWRELDHITGWGHGSTSRVLSDLHKAGRIARLTEERNRCKVYVLPEYVNGRETEPHGGRGRDRQFVSTETATIMVESEASGFMPVEVKVLVTIWKDGTMEAQVRPDPDDRFSRWSELVRLVEVEL